MPLIVWTEGNLVKCTAQSRQRGFRAPFTVGYAEGPVGDVVTSAIPFVGPAKYESARTPFREGSPNLRIQKIALLLMAVAKAVQPDLRQHERPVAGNIL